MNRTQTSPCRSDSSRRDGLSLLEVMISTGILAGSTVMLLGLLSTGERHAKQAERRVLGQMLCQSQLDEYLAFPQLQSQAGGEPIPGYPDWMSSVKETPTEMPGVVRLDVSVTRVESSREQNPLDAARERKTFELTRLVRRAANSQAANGAGTAGSEVVSPPLAVPQP